MKGMMVTVLAGIYLFVMLFGQLFHTHPGGSTFRGLQLTKPEKIFSKAEVMQQDTGCLACHLLHESHAVMPDTFSFDALSSNHYLTKVSEHQFLYLFKLKEVSTLRGPPASRAF